MATFMDKMQLNTAVTDNTKLDFGHQRISTTSFMALDVAYARELVPGEKIEVQMESFARLNPLPVPTMGRARWNHRAFFVPMRTCFPAFDSFIVNNPHVWADPTALSTELVSSVPYFKNSSLVNVFLVHAASDSSHVDDTHLCYQVPTPGPTAPYDFYNSNVAYRFTTLGRQYYKQILDLGYKINWDDKDDTIYSGIPFLALGRIYCDHYFPQQYTANALYFTVMRLCKADTSVRELAWDDLSHILKLSTYVMYDSDAFTACFDEPNSPTDVAVSDFRIPNIDFVGTIVSGTSPVTYNITEMNGVSNRSLTASSNGDVIDRYGNMNAPFITNAVKTSAGGTLAAPISEYILHGLHAMSDWIKRNQLASANIASRYLARYGKNLSAEKLDKSLYLGCHQQDIQIGDVMSTADTSSAALGSYAGKGMSAGSASWSYTSEEFGYFFILSSIVPEISYVQGIDPQVKRLTLTQFYQPEYDALGVAPVTADLLYQSDSGITYNQNSHESVFGFLPRYYDYKVPTFSDRLTGNFACPSLNGANTSSSQVGFNAADSWHLARLFRDADFTGSGGAMDPSLCVHSVGFVRGYDRFQYNRIFAAGNSLYTSPYDIVDGFTVINNFNEVHFFPGKSLFDTYEFEDKGRKISLDANGVKMN